MRGTDRTDRIKSEDYGTKDVNSRYRNASNEDLSSEKLSKICSNQAEEIRMLYEQLQQRDIDLKEIRYEYVAALKEKKSVSENANKINNTPTSTKISEMKKRNSNNNNNISSSGELKAENTDDDEYFSSSPEVINQSPSPSRKYMGRNPRERPQENSRSDTVRDSRELNENDLSSIINEKPYFQSSLIRTRHPKYDKNRKENHDAHEKHEEEQLNDGRHSVQLADLIAFRETATKDYEALRITHDLLKRDSEEKRNIVEDTCGRLIRFVTGGKLLSFSHTNLGNVPSLSHLESSSFSSP